MLYSFVRRVVRAILRATNQMKVTARAAVPAEGPLVVVANHESLLDGFVLAAAITERPLTFLSASHLFDKPLVGTFLRAVGALPVQMHGDNFGSLRRAMAILREGGAVVVFPKGGVLRSEIIGGAVYLALRTDAPILPVYLKGTKEALPPGRPVPSLSSIEVTLGRPFRVAPPDGDRTGMRRAVSEDTEKLERTLRETRSPETFEEGAHLELLQGEVR